MSDSIPGMRAALDGLALWDRAQQDVEEAEKAYAATLGKPSIRAYFESARRLDDVHRARARRDICASVSMPVFFPAFAQVIRARATGIEVREITAKDGTR